MHEPTGPEGVSSPSPDKNEAEPRVVPVVEEQATLSRVTEETGAAVRVRVETREDKTRIPATDIVEETTIERRPINRFVTERTPPREEGDVVIVPVFETVAVVEMRLLLKEEVRIVRRRREVAREEEVVLRKEIPVVERKDPDEEEWRPDPSA